MDSNEIFQDMTKGKGKELASELSCSVSYIYQMRRGDEPNVLDKVETYMNKSDNDNAIQWLCASRGGFFFRDIDRTSDMDFKIVPQILSEFSEFLAVLADSLADGKVTDREEARLDKEWNDVQAIVQTLKGQIKRGDYR